MWILNGKGVIHIFTLCFVEEHVCEENKNLGQAPRPLQQLNPQLLMAEVVADHDGTQNLEQTPLYFATFDSLRGGNLFSRDDVVYVVVVLVVVIGVGGCVRHASDVVQRISER